MTEDQKNSNANTNTDTEVNGSAAEIKSETELLNLEVTKWKNEYLYLRAEFENYKKNNLKERSDLIKFGPERIARDILEVSDNFERALDLKITAETFDKFKQGIEMTAKELKEALTKHGISEIPTLNQPFNPQFFEAISSEETKDFAEGTITRVFKKAYKLHDKTIRLGQVVVATKPKKESSDVIN